MSNVVAEREGTFRRVGMSLTLVGLAVGAHVAFPAVLSRHLPFAPFALAILVSCRCAGRMGGTVATVASAIVLRAWFLAPAASLLDEGRLGLGLFVVAGLIVSWQGTGKQ